VHRLSAKGKLNQKQQKESKKLNSMQNVCFYANPDESRSPPFHRETILLYMGQKKLHESAKTTPSTHPQMQFE
jgi:hypothetical protein